MNISGVVILYNPDDEIIQRIATYRTVLQNLYLIDNSETSNKKLLEPLLREQRVFYFHDCINEGIAKRLNQAANRAIRDGASWLLTMDQDSFFEKAALHNYLKRVSSCPDQHQVSMFGIEYDKRLVSTKEGPSFQPVTHLITSGSLLNLNLFPVIGNFDEKLFIDHVDHEYCFRSIVKGFGIIKLDNIPLNHSLGLVSQFRSLKNLKVTPRALHSPVRIYYMTRNFLYLARLYRSTFPAEIIQFRNHLFNRIKNNLLYNKKRTLVLKYIVKGLLDFRANKMGKI